jgi:hypothetical protein
LEANNSASSTADLKDGPCTGNTMSSRDSRIRWNVVPTRSGNGWFWYVVTHLQWLELPCLLIIGRY